MTEQQELENRLNRREIKPTSVRVLVLKTLIDSANALSMSDIETLLPSLDKSSVFRTLTIFLEHKLVHSIDDGTGALKYALCSDSCNCTLGEEHIHFYCEGCGKTFCFKGLHIPSIALPQGFVSEQANFVFKGLCAACNSIKSKES